ncbi:hypothetical protein B6E66_07925 [Streptomyces maremycinicus]|nr:hypothetical protein B6E66_07925 [Streptomyces sp. B9173]
MTAEPGERAVAAPGAADVPQEEPVAPHPGTAPEHGTPAAADTAAGPRGNGPDSSPPGRSMFAGRAGIPRRSAMSEARMAAVRVVGSEASPDAAEEPGPGAAPLHGPGADPGSRTPPPPGSPPGPPPGPRPEPRPRPEPDPGLGLALGLDLGLLVPSDVPGARPAATATATTTATGRSKKALLAGAAVAGAVLIAVPFLVSAVGDDGGRDSAASTTVDGRRDDQGTGHAPDAFGSASPSSDSTSHLTSVGAGGKKDSEGVEGADGAPGTEDGAGDDGNASTSTSKDTAKSSTTGTSSSGRATTGTGGSSTVAGVPIRSHASGKCVDVSGGVSKDGAPLDIRGCAETARMSWTFASDGTVRALGRCMDVAGGSTSNGAQVRLAECSGSPSQRFRLNDAHDLVNRQADRCVDVTDARTADGSPLQLWDCTGADHQKWSKG